MSSPTVVPETLTPPFATSQRTVNVSSRTPRAAVQTSSSRREALFMQYIRERVIGSNVEIPTPFGPRPLRYFDFIASGRCHLDVEDELNERVLPYMANTHTESTYGGRLMTEYYHNAFSRIAGYLHASADDVLIPVGSGSTGAINRMIRVLGIRVPDQLDERYQWTDRIPATDRPVIFRSLMEHHSNDIAWRETIGDTVYIDFDEHGCISVGDLDAKLERYRDHPWKIGTFSAASNVTGILNDCHGLARVLHQHSALAFFDFAAAGPYVDVDMHPLADPDGYFDAIFFSVHKFLGGPRTPGLLVANRKLFTNRVPAEPGGGTVLYTSPWDHRYLASIEHRETGGTPPILQSIQAGLAFDLKAAIGAERIERIEQDYLRRALRQWLPNENLIVLGNLESKRLGVVSLIFQGLHHNLAATLFNDLYGIQVRGGCMCAGPYGHLLLHIDEQHSSEIRCRLDEGHIGEKPGWVRIGFSPTVSEEEFQVLLEAVDHISKNGKRYESQYELSDQTGEWSFRG
ncbi:aminotransferase class V-fold PLP-dependent enzyme [candidate division KSB1 bacterium]|nr:aminotransferase class V-fold PLP-dependent enzyme [candidate division KSB1 bacterium]